MQKTASWTLALVAFVVLAAAPMMAADPKIPVTQPQDLQLSATPEPDTPGIPSLESQLEKLTGTPSRVNLSCPIGKCDPVLCPPRCVCRIVNCNEIQCQPLPWDPDSCQ